MKGKEGKGREGKGREAKQGHPSFHARWDLAKNRNVKSSNVSL